MWNQFCLTLMESMEKNIPSRTVTDVPLESASAQRYLGVEITSSLDWSVHINTIATKANKTLGLLRRHLKHCTPKVKEIAYRTLVRPQMEYCSSVWDPYEKGDVATLEKVQRRVARFVKGDYKRESSVTQMICDLGWQSLEARRAVSRLSLMYKIAHGLVDVESQILVRSGLATRQSQGQHNRNILALKSCYRASFFPRTVPEWNHLPPSYSERFFC